MTIIDDKIRDEKLQYDSNREAAIIPALSSGKIDKYEVRKQCILIKDKQKKALRLHVLPQEKQLKTKAKSK